MAGSDTFDMKINDRQAVKFNQQAWDEIAKRGNYFYRTATAADIHLARSGEIRIQLTPIKRVPPEWIGNIADRKVLCLASAGGQQGPLFAAAGADVTVFDISQRQLERDRRCAAEYGLQLAAVQGDMADLSCFADSEFDLIVCPCSICYCPDPGLVWRQVQRVLKPGGSLLAGLINPVNYIFDVFQQAQGQLGVRHTIPYSEAQLTAAERQLLAAPHRPVEFGHSLTRLIGLQIDAGLVLTGFYEDRWGNDDLLSRYIDLFFATRSLKPE